MRFIIFSTRFPHRLARPVRTLLALTRLAVLAALIISLVRTVWADEDASQDTVTNRVLGQTDFKTPRRLRGVFCRRLPGRRLRSESRPVSPRLDVLVHTEQIVWD